MFPLNSQQAKSIDALIVALSKQEEALPTGLQQQLNAIGQNLAARAVEIPAIAASLPELNKAYQAALADTSDNRQAAAKLVSATNSDDGTAKQIFTAPDPVKAAQKEVSPTLGQIASNPIKRLFNRG